jgi:hypothetical protein
MKASDIDWGTLRGALIFLCAALIVSIALFAGGQYIWHKASDAHEAERSSLNSVRGQYQSLDDERRLIEDYLPRFEELDEKGIIGEEHRLNWVEALREAASLVKLPGLRYEIYEQKEYIPEFPVETGTLKLYGSDMSLEIALLHEGDLPALLRVLRRQAQGVYSVQECKLIRPDEELQRNPKKPNLRATCELTWFTIREPGEEENKS